MNGNNISNFPLFIDFLKKEKNSYSEFILSTLNRDPNSLNGITTQMHHIIPKHASGPDQKWNMIQLTIEEHVEKTAG